MKSLGRTIIVLIALNLITACYALAQPAPAPAPSVSSPAASAEANAEEVQMEAAKNTGERAGKALSKLSKDLGELRFNFGDPFSRSGAGAVMVIPTSEMKTEDIATITEDMTVMSRIIDKQLGKESTRQSWVYGDFIGQSFGGRMSETMYLQGYGALFLKKVDFPLSPTQQVQEEEKKPQKEDVDPVWEQTRQDIYEPQEDRESQEPSEVKYDAEKVENLKTNLIKALNHATNIRSLKPEESVIVTVTGSGDSSKAKTVVSRVIVQRQDRGTQRQDRRSTGIVTPYLQNESGLSSTATLIIRTKRADIDSFAKGDLDLDKFRQRVQIFTQ